MLKSGFVLFLLLVLSSISTFAQQSDYLHWYSKAFDSVKANLEANCGSFKKAVFFTESAYWGDSISFRVFNEKVQNICKTVSQVMELRTLDNYHHSDSLNVWLNYAIASTFTDTNLILGNSRLFINLPYTYDFNDFAGRKDWSKMLVSKLLVTRSGNCHSIPYLYKIVADEMGASCWLSMAPNHIYIKNRCKKIGWYNTELTSGTFPIDAWIMGSGYISLEAIQNGIFMDTLGHRQAIALCAVDLAKGYEQQTGNYYDGFILKCCDLSLTYFPVNVQALLLKAETLKRIYNKENAENKGAAKERYAEMEKVYVSLAALGYREMPDKMYRDWLQSVVKEKKVAEALKKNLKAK